MPKEAKVDESRQNRNSKTLSFVHFKETLKVSLRPKNSGFPIKSNRANSVILPRIQKIKPFRYLDLGLYYYRTFWVTVPQEEILLSF